MELSAEEGGCLDSLWPPPLPPCLSVTEVEGGKGTGLVLKQGENRTKCPRPRASLLPGIPGKFLPGVPALLTPAPSPAPPTSPGLGNTATVAQRPLQPHPRSPGLMVLPSHDLGLHFCLHCLLIPQVHLLNSVLAPSDTFFEGRNLSQQLTEIQDF